MTQPPGSTVYRKGEQNGIYHDGFIYILIWILDEIGRASCRERVQISVVAVSLKKKKKTKEKEEEGKEKKKEEKRAKIDK